MAVLAPFDHKREFEVRRKGFVYAGHAYKVGEAFNKIDVAPRKLEMLYNGRFIGFVDEVIRAKAPIYTPRAVDPVPEPASEPVEPEPIVQADADPEPVAPTVEERIETLMANNTKAALIDMAIAADIKVDRVSAKAVIAAAIVQADADGIA